MFKLYIHHFMSHKHAKEGIEYCFCSDAANARCWGTKEDAGSIGVNIKRHPIRIVSSEGTPFFCSNFEIEQRAPSEFVIFYEVPFIPVDAIPESDDEITAS